MTQGPPVSGPPTSPSTTALALDEVKPYVLTAAAVGILGAPAEFAVPVVRRLRGRSGVSVAPGLTNLLNAVVALGVVHAMRRNPGQWQRWKQKDIPPWVRIAGLLHLAVSPAVAAASKRGVVLEGRTPLWGVLVSPVGLLQGVLVLGALSRARAADGRRGQEM